MWGDLGRSGEIWGALGRYGVMWGDCVASAISARSGEIWGRYGEIWGDCVASAISASVTPRVHTQLDLCRCAWHHSEITISLKR